MSIQVWLVEMRLDARSVLSSPSIRFCGETFLDMKLYIDISAGRVLDSWSLDLSKWINKSKVLSFSL